MPSRSAYIGQLMNSGSAVGQVVSAAVSPGANFIDAALWTEADVNKLRSGGVLPKTGSWQKATGSGTSLSTGGNNNWDLPSTRGFVMAGNGKVGYSSVSSSNASTTPGAYCWPLHSLANFQGTSLGTNAFNPTTDTVKGVSYIEQTKETIFAANAASVVAPSGGPATRYTGNPGGRGGVRYLGGKYVFFGLASTFINGGGSFVPQYTTDFVTFTNCVLPALNADSGAGGAWISWMEYDAVNNRLVAMTYYGEILVSTDGINFTKSAAKAAGGTSIRTDHFAINAKTGKVFVGSALGLFTAADVTTTPATTALAAPGGHTLGGTPVSVACTFGAVAVVTGLAVASSSATVTFGMVSVDDGATWTEVMTGANLNTWAAGHVVASEGVFNFFLYSNGFTVNVYRVFSDGERHMASISQMTTYQTDYLSGLTPKPWIRTS